MVKAAVLKVYPSAPYDLAVTDRDELNARHRRGVRAERVLGLNVGVDAAVPALKQRVCLRMLW